MKQQLSRFGNLLCYQYDKKRYIKNTSLSNYAMFLDLFFLFIDKVLFTYQQLDEFDNR